MKDKEIFFKRAAADVKLIIIDNDGVLNDGFIGISESGHRIKTFWVQDSMALQKTHEAGMTVEVFTWEVTEIMKKWGVRWGIDGIHGTQEKKFTVLEEISLRLDIPHENILYIGDDIDDLECLQTVGFSACPDNAADVVKEVCDYVSPYHGGRGAVRDILRNILTAKGLWPVPSRE